MNTTRMMAAGLLILFAAATGRAADSPANRWTKVTEGGTGQRTGAVLVNAPDGRLLLFGGSAGEAPYVQAFDRAAGRWSEFAAAAPQRRGGINPYYQAACDPKTNKLYCLSDGLMAVLDLKTKTWMVGEKDAALKDLSWSAVAIDPAARKLVVVGADKRPDNVGWSRTVVMDLDSGQWTALAPPDTRSVAEHKALVAGIEELIGLVGQTRMAWYRDPAGMGTDAERKELSDRCAALRKLPALADWSDDLAKVADLLAAKKTLEALTASRAIQRKIELAAEARYPVPPSRRNSPLAFDPANKVFVLFGGDHEDYLTNDTWVLDLAKGWRRAKPPVAPSPRAGHALVALPSLGRVAMYEGYVQTTTSDYGARPWTTLLPQQLWLYDAKADRWDLVGDWQAKRGEEPASPPPVGAFYGYSGQYYSPPALACDGKVGLVLEAPAAGRGGRASTWTLTVDSAATAAARQAELAAPPNERFYRGGRFVAAYCEVPDAPEPTNMDKLPANQWVKLPAPPRNVTVGARGRVWGTAVWDSDNDQVLFWGGGHCIRSASPPIHYSPESNRMVEGYDADEPYSANGGGGEGSSVMNRPWVPVHGYNHYAFDPVIGKLVTDTGYLYDPVRMDWMRDGPMDRPFRFEWGSTVIETSPHGVVVWTQAIDSETVGLWMYDKAKGWVDLKPDGRLYQPYCDSEGMTYDAKRDRMLLGWGGGYNKKGDGSITGFDFKTRKVSKLAPANPELGQISNTREMVYVDHADWVLFGGEPYRTSRERDAKQYTHIYDCAADKWMLLDAGASSYGHSAGWMYDAKRKLVYVINSEGAVYALRIDPSTAKLVEKP